MSTIAAAVGSSIVGTVTLLYASILIDFYVCDIMYSKEASFVTERIFLFNCYNYAISYIPLLYSEFSRENSIKPRI